MDHPQSGRPTLRADRVHVVQNIMDDLTANTSTESSSTHEAEKRTGIPELSIRRILHDLYPCKMQALHQLLPADTGGGQNSATWALA